MKLFCLLCCKTQFLQIKRPAAQRFYHRTIRLEHKSNIWLNGIAVILQYQTGIYYTDDKQLPEIEAVYREQEETAGAKLAVEMEPIRNFFSAEEYHQKYLDKNPGGYCHIPSSYLGMCRDSGK